MTEKTGKTRETTKKCISDKVRVDFSKRISALADEIKCYGITALYRELLRNGVITSEYKINTFRTKYKRIFEETGGLLSDLELIGPILQILDFPTSFLFMDTVKKDDTSILVNAIRDTIRKELFAEKTIMKIKEIPTFPDAFNESYFFFSQKYDLGIIIPHTAMYSLGSLYIELLRRMKDKYPKTFRESPFKEIITLLLKGPFSDLINQIQNKPSELNYENIAQNAYLDGRSVAVSLIYVYCLILAYHVRLIHRLSNHLMNNDYINFGKKPVAIVEIWTGAQGLHKSNFLCAVKDLEESLLQLVQACPILSADSGESLEIKVGILISCLVEINKVLSIFLFNTVPIISPPDNFHTIFEQNPSSSRKKHPVFSIMLTENETTILQSISQSIRSIIDNTCIENAQSNKNEQQSDNANHEEDISTIGRLSTNPDARDIKQSSVDAIKISTQVLYQPHMSEKRSIAHGEGQSINRSDSNIVTQALLSTQDIGDSSTDSLNAIFEQMKSHKKKLEILHSSPETPPSSITDSPLSTDDDLVDSLGDS